MPINVWNGILRAHVNQNEALLQDTPHSSACGLCRVAALGVKRFPLRVQKRYREVLPSTRVTRPNPCD